MTLPALLTEKETSFVYVENTDLSADNGYNMTLAYLAKNIQNSNHAIQLKDKSKKKIISHISILCDGLNYSSLGMTFTYNGNFTIEADFKNNKARFAITASSYYSNDPRGDSIPFRANQKDALKKCVDKLRSELISALKVSTDNNW